MFPKRISTFTTLKLTKQQQPYNNETGFESIFKMAQELHAIVCYEPTGSYEQGLIRYLQNRHIQIAFCDGLRVRYFAFSRNIYIKNDHVDARMISEFATQNNPRILSPKTEGVSRLQKAWDNYQTLINMASQLSVKAELCEKEKDKKLFQKLAKTMCENAEEQFAECEKIISDDAEKKRFYDTATSVTGIGPKTATMVLALLPEIGTLSDKAVAKLAGLAPAEKQSGKMDRTRHIYGGRKELRNGLYMSAISAVRSNHILRPYYLKLKDRMPGVKASKWALVTIMRKIIILLNKIARDPKFVPQTKPNTEKKDASKPNS